MTREGLLTEIEKYDAAAIEWQRQADQAQANVFAAQGAAQALRDLLDRFYPDRLEDVLSSAGLKQTEAPVPVS